MPTEILLLEDHPGDVGLTQEAFRFNNRELNDGGRFITALAGFSGKRLTYKSLIGKDESEGAQGNGNGAENGPLN